MVAASKEKLLLSRSESTNLFDRQLRNKQWDRTIGTEDITSTCICLIAMHRHDATYAQKVLDVSRTFESLITRYHAENYAGALGLIVWANAVWKALDFSELFRRIGLDHRKVQEVFPQITTMELAWLLSGLVHEQKNRPSDQTRRLLEVCELAVHERYSPSGRLFYHCSPAARWQDRVRRRVANFADQIYPVHALAMMSLLDRSATTSASIASAAAERLCERQGPLGEWWWHYHPDEGKVLQHYPVYSVHQHGMAPMALMAVERASGRSYADRIALSFRWLSANKMSVNLIDHAAGTVWRNIDVTLSGPARSVQSLRSILNMPAAFSPDGAHSLEVNYETRPYEWGWLLYAHAIGTGRPGDNHLL